MQNQNQQETFDLLDPKRILAKVFSNWYIFLASISLALAAAYYITKETTPIFQAEGTLLISEDKNDFGFDIFSSSGGNFANSSLQNEIVVLSTYTTALETVKKLELNVTYYRESLWRIKPFYNQVPLHVQPNWDKPQLIDALFKISPIDRENFSLEILESDQAKSYKRNFGASPDSLSLVGNPKISPINAAFGQTIRSPFFEFVVFSDGNFEEPVYFRISDDDRIAKQFKADIQISPTTKETTTLQVKLQHPAPQTAKDYVNTLMETYLQQDLNERNLTSQQTLDFIDNQIKTVADSLNLYESELQSYRKINKITDVSQKGEMILSESVRIEEELNQQKLRLEYYQSLKNYLNNPEGQELLVPSVIGIEDPLFNSMVSSLIELQNEKSALRGVLSGDSFAYVRELNNKIENLKFNLNESISNAIQNISTHIRRLEGMLAVVEKDFNLLPEVERNLIAIERRFKINESIYTFLLQKKAETQIEKASTITKHRILDLAQVNSSPISPNPTRNLAIGASLGITLPLIVIILWNIFYNKVVDPKELEMLLNVPLIGFIPRDTKDRRFVLEQDSKSTVTESLRNIRSNLAIRYEFKDKGTILVTSTRPEEGKTYASIKLASIYAALGKKTLLIGLDLRKPAIHKELGIKNNKGVSTFLMQDSESLEGLIQQSEQENLFILPAGPFIEKSSELINTKKFENLIHTLKQQFDFLVFDTSPIGLVSETIDLTKYADINLFILRQNFSFLNQAQIANDLKEKLGINNLFVILNDMHKFGFDSNYYGYGYGYGYGYYSAYTSYAQDNEIEHTKKHKSIFRNLFNR